MEITSILCRSRDTERRRTPNGSAIDSAVDLALREVA